MPDTCKHVVIECKELSKAFPGSMGKVVDNVSLDCRTGQCFCLVGTYVFPLGNIEPKKKKKSPLSGLKNNDLCCVAEGAGRNGTGKSTLVSVLTGFLPPTRGTAFLCNHWVVGDQPRALRGAGVCFQQEVPALDQFFEHTGMSGLMTAVLSVGSGKTRG